MGMLACKQAYLEGAPWLDALLAYLQGNFNTLSAGMERINRRAGTPVIGFRQPEGTYLCWLDCSGLMRARGLDDDAALDRWMLNEAGIWLSTGPNFGRGGSGFMRLNAASPRTVLVEALRRLEQALF
jgi:cystathionine beta-lyase